MLRHGAGGDRRWGGVHGWVLLPVLVVLLVACGLAPPSRPPQGEPATSILPAPAQRDPTPDVPATPASSPVGSKTHDPNPTPEGSPSAVPTVPGETPLPTVAGLSSAEVASLASLEQVDDYPLYVMHYYDSDGASSRPLPDVPAGPTWGCSLFAALGDEASLLYGRNFDWEYSPALLLFAHPDDGYDSVAMVDLGYFVSDAVVSTLTTAPLELRRSLLNVLVWPFDGMNEHGLTVGMAAVPDSPLPHDAALPTLGSLEMIREILDHARDVDEALELMQSHNVSMWGGPAIHYLIADPLGRAVLVEYYEGEMHVLQSQAPWHLATNHYRVVLTDDAGTPEPEPCWRYDRLEAALTEAAGRLKLDEALALLADVQQPSTQWSVVYDMGAREVHVAMGGDYADVHTFRLAPTP